MDPVHGPGPWRGSMDQGSMDQGSMFCTFPLVQVFNVVGSNLIMIQCSLPPTIIANEPKLLMCMCWYMWSMRYCQLSHQPVLL